jgi:hypothetical protein
MIIAEMEIQRMLDGLGVPSEKMSNNRAVTPEEIAGALQVADVQLRTTPEERGVVSAANTVELLKRKVPLPPQVEMDTAVDSKIAGFPYLWPKWLCYMERAGALGGGFRVDV